MKHGIWTRVRRTGTPADEAARQEKNRATLTSKIFVDCCGRAGIPHTPRQASKWNNGYGAAYRIHKGGK